MKPSEWKRFKKLKEDCFDRYCASVLADAEAICQQDDQSNHDKYLELYRHMQAKKREMSTIFDGLSRSKAGLQLMMMHSHGLIEDQDLDQFDDEMANHIKGYSRRFNETDDEEQ